MENEESIFIHELKKLEPKTAEIESIRLIREIKRVITPPLTEEKLTSHLTKYFVKKLDIDAMEQALQKIQPVLTELDRLIANNDSLHEEINLKRARRIIQELDEPLKKNIAYAKDMLEYQQRLPKDLIQVLSCLPTAKTAQQKTLCNNNLSKIFEKILRNTEFGFKYSDIIFEAHLEHITGLINALPNGFLFRINLEEEIKKLPFSEIQARIPKSMIADSDRIQGYSALIKEGVKKAYDINMTMVNLALLIYAYVKWLTPK